MARSEKERQEKERRQQKWRQIDRSGVRCSQLARGDRGAREDRGPVASNDGVKIGDLYSVRYFVCSGTLYLLFFPRTQGQWRAMEEVPMDTLQTMGK